MRKEKNFFSITIVLLCISYILSFTKFGVSQIAQYSKFSMLFLTAVLFFLNSNKKNIFKKNDVVLFLVVSVYYGCVLIFTVSSFEDLLNWIVVVVCYLSNIIFVFSNLDLRKFKKILDIIFSSLLLGLVFPSFILSFNPNYYYVQTERHRFISFMNNPNELAQFTCIVILISFLKLCGNCSFFKKIYYAISSLISMYIVFITGSRASMIMLGSFLVFFFLSKFIGLHKIKKLLTYVYSIIVLLMILFSDYFFKKNAMLYGALDTLSSNRLSIWREILNFSDLRTFLFGGKIIKSFGDIVVTNAFIEIFGLLGTMGLILWLIILNSKIHNFKNNNTILLFQFSVLFSYLIYYQFESGMNGLANISSFFFWLVICFNDEVVLS